jgi:hypothetical protein
MTLGIGGASCSDRGELFPEDADDRLDADRLRARRVRMYETVTFTAARAKRPLKVVRAIGFHGTCPRPRSCLPAIRFAMKR